MVRNRKGFTLIELLIVVVIIGILAAIAIPKFASTKQKAYITAMKSDLRNLLTAEESYFSDYGTYATGTGQLTGFSQTTGVNVAIEAADGAGWWASATHNSLAPVGGPSCKIAVGGSLGASGLSAEGEPKCA
jgi:type IV pilus assembly protein PilA